MADLRWGQAKVAASCSMSPASCRLGARAGSEFTAGARRQGLFSNFLFLGFLPLLPPRIGRNRGSDEFLVAAHVIELRRAGIGSDTLRPLSRGGGAVDGGSAEDTITAFGEIQSGCKLALRDRYFDHRHVIHPIRQLPSVYEFNL